MVKETRAIVRLTPAGVQPHGSLVLARMQVPPGAALSEALHRLLDEAAATFERAALPGVVFDEISLGEFEHVYVGAGRNEPRTPVPAIARRAASLALFAATLGRAMDEAIASAFRDGNAALGCVLDVYASVAAERLATRAADHFQRLIEDRQVENCFVLPYSPGYCGWHVSGQRALFERLHPNELGVAVNENSLMIPIKSVSGVLIAATREAHRFSPKYPFCDTCPSRECLDRMRALRTAS